MRAEVSTAAKMWSYMVRHRCVWCVFTNFWGNTRILFPSSGRNVAQVVCLPNFITVYLTTWTQNLEANYLRTQLLTPWSSVLEKLTGFQPVKKFPAFYGTRRFITVFTIARHLSLSWASSIRPMPTHPTSWESIFILSSHLRLDLTYWGREIGWGCSKIEYCRWYLGLTGTR
jgi:hypothetical protein